MAWKLRRVFRIFWWMLTTATLLALPLLVWQFRNLGWDAHYQTWFIGGVFCILAMPISIYEVAMHTEYYTQPKLQRHVIRILWMVPIYALDAWFALRFRQAREYLDPIRECYEAFVIYSFFAYLMAYLEGKIGNIGDYLTLKPDRPHLPPFRYFVAPWTMGPKFLRECKKGILNYVIIRPLCSVLALVTDSYGVYGQGEFNPHKAYPYLAAATNFSQLWALYCLIMMYDVMHEELAPIRPLSKFICIKAVVFVTFWQGVLIAILVSTGVIKPGSWQTYDKQDMASSIQDFLICIEMFFAALAHAYAFPPRDYMDPAIRTKGFFTNARYMFDLRDVYNDVSNVVEQHVSSATNTVVSVPKQAVRKVSGHLARTPGHLRQLFHKHEAKLESKTRLLEEEEEAMAKTALLASSVESSLSGEVPQQPRHGHGPSGSGGGDRGGDVENPQLPLLQQQQQRQQEGGGRVSPQPYGRVRGQGGDLA